MTIASVAAQQNATGSTGTSGSALSSLSGNLDTFLKLLMTQLQNQDPTSPLDTAQFTSQLVQYSSVEQQIKTNTNLTSLLQLTQANEVVQSASLLGKKAEVSSDQLALQGGAATVKFDASAAGKVNIVVLDAAGGQVASDTIDTTVGSNTWTWDGTNSAGTKLPDGAYRVAVLHSNGAGGTAAIPTTIVGTVTGVDSTGSSVKVRMGQLAVEFANLRSLKP